ncbi:MAG: hypothetical protein PHR28_01470 [candidate division Zixibacteria bacterium]|nr:hypothetical protein [candidate division Zixibacteria bacterium]
MKINKLRAAAVIAAALLAAGCIMTATYVVTVRLAPNPLPIKVSTVSDSSAVKRVVDLRDDSDFRDNQDKIKDIESIGFYLKAKNNLADAVTFQLFLEEDTTKDWEDAQMVADSSTELIFTGLTIPGNQTVTVDWNQSMGYVTGLPAIKKILEGGRFSIYPVAIPRNNFSVTIDSLVVIVTVSGG